METKWKDLLLDVNAVGEKASLELGEFTAILLENNVPENIG